MEFPTDYKTILNRMENIEPLNYAKSRNFVDGAVTYLSPYISRGVISVKQVMDTVMTKGYKNYQIEKFIQELAWREYWQRVWGAVNDDLFTDLKQPQPDVVHHKVPATITDAVTGIKEIDKHIELLCTTGYMHNHVRMYVACLCCNVAKAHWLQPSQWLYYHLLDGDLASNTLSWQWVAGSFSSKKYYCNQENINKYTHSSQEGTFMDKPYAEIVKMDVPETLQHVKPFFADTALPETVLPAIDRSKPTLIYNSYNLSPVWRANEDVNRILLLEPSHFKKFPVNEKVIQFIVALAGNIKGIQVYTAEFNELKAICGEMVYKEHTAFKHYTGIADDRDWIAPDVSGYFPSFFSFYKKVKKASVLL